MIHSLFDLLFIFGSGTPRPLGDFAGYGPASPSSETMETPAGTPFGNLCLYPRGDLHPLFISALVKNPEFLSYAETCGEGGMGKRRFNGERLMAFELSGQREGGRRNRRDICGEFNRFARAAEKKLAHNQEELRLLQELQRTLICP
jgi:hypothetical protein